MSNLREYEIHSSDYFKITNNPYYKETIRLF